MLFFSIPQQREEKLQKLERELEIQSKITEASEVSVCQFSGSHFGIWTATAVPLAIKILVQMPTLDVPSHGIMRGKGCIMMCTKWIVYSSQ